MADGAALRDLGPHWLVRTLLFWTAGLVTTVVAACGDFASRPMDHGAETWSNDLSTEVTAPDGDAGGDSSACVTNTDCDDGNACTASICHVSGVCQQLPLGTACEGGSCGPGLCQAGSCVVSDAVCEDGEPCTFDHCGPKGCEHNALSGPCNDGVDCTSNDTCVDGVCVAATPCICTSPSDCADGDPCTADVCDPEEQVCIYLPAEATCDDNNLCTDNDVCDKGECIGTDVSCDDGEQCTSDYCNTESGCRVFFSSWWCDDGIDCTAEDRCFNGTCVGTSNDCPCGETGCDDGDDCTLDACDAGTNLCSFNPINCDDGNPCTWDGCLSSSGTCKGFEVFDGYIIEACELDPCSVAWLSCVQGVATCQWSGPNVGSGGAPCDGGTCYAGDCVVPEPDAAKVVSAEFAGQLFKAGQQASLVVKVKALAVPSAAKVTVDLTSVDGGAEVPLAFAGVEDDIASFSAQVATTGLKTGNHQLPVVATSASGTVAKGTAVLLVYTGSALHVGPGKPYTEIHPAVVAAKDDDAVVVHAGTYTGKWNKNLPLYGKRIVVVGIDGPDQTILDCEDDGRGLNVLDTGETAATTVARLSIQACPAGAVRVGTTDGPQTSLSLVGCRLIADANNLALEVMGSSASLQVVTTDIVGPTVVSGGANLDVGFSEVLGTASTDAEDIAIAVGIGSSLALWNSQLNGHAIGINAVEADLVTVTDSTLSNHGLYGVRAFGSDVHVTGTTFEQNGVGLDFVPKDTDTLSVQGSTFRYNTAGGLAVHGQGFDNNQPAKVDIGSCKFLLNESSGPGAGALFERVLSLHLHDSTFEGNLAVGNGGGLAFSLVDGYLLGGCDIDVTLARNRFLRNQTTGYGGGMWLESNLLGAQCGPNVDTNFIARDSEFVENKAMSGGGLATSLGFGIRLALTNALFAYNTADAYGGGYMAAAGGYSYLAQVLYDVFECRATNLTVVGNEAGKEGGGIYVSEAWIEIGWSIIFGNQSYWSEAGHDVRLVNSAGTLASVSMTAVGSAGVGDSGGKLNGGMFGLTDNKGNLLIDNPKWVQEPDKMLFRLAQFAAGQGEQSPCVNAKGVGQKSAAQAGLDKYSTRTDGMGDTGLLDMGYHYAQ